MSAAERAFYAGLMFIMVVACVAFLVALIRDARRVEGSEEQ